ncbi:hypothetical protein EVAR_33081_1 [Eumeta japonica]|uniref:Uncharacterized protein n=1 Tax=Eumeta variegata TaxID=151549 RepID=A0A4C2A8B4_EUMVA|nr:hypothetical protein EVAR_33081_1 [Eumeta japonica]
MRTHILTHTHMEACNRVGNKKTPGLKGIPNEGQLDKLPHPTNGHMAKMEIWRRQLLSDTNDLRARMLQGILTQVIQDAEQVFFTWSCFNSLRNTLETALKEKIRSETIVEVTLSSPGRKAVN